MSIKLLFESCKRWTTAELLEKHPPYVYIYTYICTNIYIDIKGEQINKNSRAFDLSGEFFLIISTYVQEKLEVRTLIDAHWLYIGCTLAVRWLYIGCTVVVHWLYIGCILAAHWLYIGWNYFAARTFYLHVWNN